LRLEKTGFSSWELIFAIFWKLRSNGTDNIFVFYLSKSNRNTDKQHANVKQINQCYSVAFSPSKQYSSSSSGRVPSDDPLIPVKLFS